MKPDPRDIAFRVLVRWQSSPMTLDQVLDASAGPINQLPRKDKRLFNALVFGVLRQREALDRIIRAFSRIPLEKIQTTPLMLMRLALYQMVHMDRVPDFAAINTAVDLAKKEKGQKTAGFVNAVLRKSVNGYADLALPDPSLNPAQYLSVRYSMPDWLTRRWLDNWGFEKTKALMDRISRIPAITIRTNTLKTDRQTLTRVLSEQALSAAPTRYAAQGLRFSRPGQAIADMPAFQDGWFQVQDEAAQLVTEWLAPRPGERVLDACAGLGGKTGHLAQLMENQGHITALDTDGRKLKHLEEAARRLDIRIIKTRKLDILKTGINDFDTYFDRVLVDAPCSGLGVIRRNPDTRYKRRPSDITRLCGRQKKFLNAAANLVKPGGSMVYAVCSCEPEENHQVVTAFLKKRKDFTLAGRKPSGPAADLITPEGHLKTYPLFLEMDGFFAARFRRSKRQEGR